MSERAAIEATIQTYFDSMYQSSKDMVNAAFHPNAKVTGIFAGEFHEMSRDEFGDLVAAQQPSPQENGETLNTEILSIEVAGITAGARVRDEYLGFTFLDTLSLVKADETWVIYNKLFHIESGP
ncbi:MAG: nuclear transport factor 2 family protein [Gemmatimonadota bacterium]|nr:nuclear transport factor 2 family protein [Gemmatimonadota bacterium]|tara:strand:- start:403 stop:774 length:372 start_codon:yes stop_codon:yes gene_type:complete